MRPVHILAKREDIAEKVITAGDPERVKQVASYLDEAKLVNENRGLLVYTGEYKGVPVTIATHGIGAPSANIVFEELRMLGAKVIIRLGTAGSLHEKIRVGDFIVVSGAAYIHGGNSIGMYVPGCCMPTAPSPDVTVELIREAEALGEKVFLGPVFSSDAFYAEDPEFVSTWSKRGVLAVEMECAGLFSLGWLRGFKTGALLVISDTLVGIKTEMLTAKELAPRVEKASKVVLNTIVKIDVS